VQLKLGLLRELDQFQSARLYFCSYPACPDVVALVKCATCVGCPVNSASLCVQSNVVYGGRWPWGGRKPHRLVL